MNYLGRFRAAIECGAFSDAFPGKLLLERNGELEIGYAPFEHINASARVVIVGLTPGMQQAINALTALRHHLQNGMDERAALGEAKRFASFSGAMRNNLVAMLDHVGVTQAIGISTSADLFAPGNSLAHFTSVLRYPVFMNGKNYSGSPHPLRSSFLQRYVEQFFAEEVRALPDAWYVPLGGPATDVLLALMERGFLREECVLDGLPHPSGANAERIAYFLGRKQKEHLSAKTNPESIDARKADVIRKITMVTGKKENAA